MKMAVRFSPTAAVISSCHVSGADEENVMGVDGLEVITSTTKSPAAAVELRAQYEGAQMLL